MWRIIKNFVSYLWFVLSLDSFQLVSTIIDILILIWTIINWREVAFQPSLLLLFLGVLINFIWQIFNVAGHFSFLKEEDPRDPLMSMLKKGKEDKKNYSLIKTDHELFLLEFPYTVNEEWGVLENLEIDKLLIDNNIVIRTVLSENKRKDTQTYIRQYKDTLLKFLNHRWYEISKKGGMFTNDGKLCLASEIFRAEDGTFKWRVTKGCYYHGYLTNFIYTQYVGGTHYKLFPPVNMNTDPIRTLGNSDFSDHIGVSTLLLTRDGYVFIFRQAGNAGYNANYYMPTGSGSMDFADFIPGEDMREIIIRGAEREMAEESSLKKLLGETEFSNVIKTSVIGYYRDLERGGKPEFCCVSNIDKSKEDVIEYIRPNVKEIATKSGLPFLLRDDEKWQSEILPEASLSLKMNYKFIKRFVNQGTQTRYDG